MLSIWFVLAVVLNSENNFIIAKLTVWVWCVVAIMNGEIVHVFAYMVKQLNYVWLTAELTA